MPDAKTPAQRTELFESLAQKYGVGVDTVRQLYESLIAGGGYQAQFSLPELGGMGQWSSGGMLMIGDMFNHGLKAKVADLCWELSQMAQVDAASRPTSFQSQHQGDGSMRSYDSWYPAELGMPSSSGSQNSMRYAFFPSTQRLAISDGVHTKVYDTEDHQISGVSQQQGNGQDLAFSSQHGPVALSSLRRIDASDKTAEDLTTSASVPETRAAAVRPYPEVRSGSDQDDIISTIERLAGLHAKGILTDGEFQTKKAELLSRL